MKYVIQNVFEGMNIYKKRANIKVNLPVPTLMMSNQKENSILFISTASSNASTKL